MTEIDKISGSETFIRTRNLAHDHCDAVNAKADGDPSCLDSHNLSHKKKIGAFYTPLHVTSLLCNWGIRSARDLILEPCFGGCTFLEASVETLRALGQAQPENNIYGFDIDPLAFRYLTARLGSDTLSTHFFRNDFLTVFPEEAGPKSIDLVIGNPPYIRHDNFDERQKSAVIQWQKKYRVSLNGRSSLWAYFLLHALHFLKPGGRMAWVLPSSFLTAKYAKEIRKKILESFSFVSVISLTERLFLTEGTRERTVVLLAEGFLLSSCSVISSSCVDSITELKNKLNNRERNVTIASFTRSSSAGTGMVPDLSAVLITELSKAAGVRKLGDLATVQIGVVTGNANFFIKSSAAWKQIGIEKRHLQYIAPRSLWIEGINVRAQDAAAHEKSSVPCLALNSPVDPRSRTLTAYLNTYPLEEVKKNSTFSRRNPWFRFLDDNIPDAFLVFMTKLGPRIVINNVKANCTNSLYRVYFDRRSVPQKKLIAISVNSTFSQLSAELLGHGRGSGALKLDPSDALCLGIYVPSRNFASIEKAFNDIDKLIRAKKFDEARNYADDYLFSDAPHFMRALPDLRSGLQISRDRRARRVNED